MGRTSVVIAVLACIQVAYAIRCWKCDNALDNDDCLRKGRAVWCRGNQHGCQSEVRYHWGFIPPIRITKRCKQGLACGNNVGQNEQGFFPFQCNPHIPESICRCCCDTDDCNKPELGCLPSYPECRQLNEVENGQMDCHFGTLPPSVGEVCQFRCDPGFELVGAEKLECNALGRNSADWSDDEPSCQPLQCQPEFTQLEKGYVQCSNANNVHSECDWECEPGYSMKGHPKSTCMDSQNWDYPMPECLPIVCPPPLIPNANSMMECSDGNMAGSTCSFTCEDGFVIQGEPNVLCQDDFNGDQFGVWSDPIPKCVPLLCQPQSRNPANGRVSCTNSNFGGSTCSYSCEPGFAPSPLPAFRTCLDDGDGDSEGRWSDPEPKCKPIRCIPDQSAPENGVRNCDNQNMLGSVCEIFCSDGLTLRGSALTICMDDGDGDDIGVWSDPPPTCEPDPCQPEFVDPSDGHVQCTDRNNYRSTCTFTCNRGFYMVSEAGNAIPSSTLRSVCGKYAEWTKQAPSCEPIKCNPPQREDDTLFVDCTDDNNYLSVCRFECKDGTKPEGNPSTECQDDGNGDAEGIWAPPSRPTCRPRICQPPQIDPQNGRVTCTDENRYPSICSFSCNPGFYLAAPGGEAVGLDGYDVECGENSLWDRKPPICRPIVCLPKHTNPSNGNVRCTKENTYLSRCDFKCDAGYEMIGMPESLCNDVANGTPYGEWSSPAPTCENAGCQPPLRAPENGGMMCSDESNFKSICSFTCNPGYYLVNSNGINVPRGFRSQCQADNTWSEEEPTCRPITCLPARSDPINGDVSCTDGIQWKSECTYACDDGYKLSPAFPTTECQDDGNGDANGQWSRPAPKCLPTSCSPKQVAPMNGKVTCTDGNTFGSVCTFSCNTGYYMLSSAGSVVRQNSDNTECGPGSRWTRAPPKCAPIRCNPHHRAPADGSVLCSNTNFHASVCSFKCDIGYDLSGTPKSTCEDDGNGDEEGQWSSPPPTCSIGACKPPRTDPLNGFVTCDNGNEFGSVCTYKCNPGYYQVHSTRTILSNDITTRCQADKTWSREPPTCEPITCQPPHISLVNGEVDCTNSNIYRSDCAFHCNQGYVLVPGRGSRQTGSPYVTNCGEDSILGDRRGEWSDEAPTCKPGVCLPPKRNPTNGKVTCTNSNIMGSICTYTCNAGYYMIGSNLQTINVNNLNAECLNSLFWDNDEPSCLPITCPPPHRSPTNGEVTCSNRNFHLSECNFECEPGYDLSGSPTSTCNDDLDGDAEGVWSNPPPTCSIGACKPPRTDPLNGAVTCDNGNEFGSVCTYTCNPGYYQVHSTRTILSNDVTTRCQADKTWSREPSTCEPITCRPPHISLLNGEVDCTNSNIYRSDCTFQCNAGYFLVPGRGSRQTGSPYVTNCGEDAVLGDRLGEWSDEAPTCSPITCSPPHRSPTNGEVTCSNRNFHLSECNFECDPGYDLSGSPTSTCNDDLDGDAEGVWSNPPPTCSIGACKPPRTDPLNGAVTCDNGNEFGSVCTYTCNPGYYQVHSTRTVLSNDVTTRCQADKTWSREPPTCEPITCRPPHISLVNGEVDCTNSNIYRSDCAFQCNDGYFLVPGRGSRQTGSPYVTNCGEDSILGDRFGEWSDEAPTCSPITCSPPHRSPRNGEVTCSNRNFYMSECDFECDPGYDLSGSPTSTCNDDLDGDAEGEWSHPAPTCTIGACKPPRTDPVNGRVICIDGNNFNSVCTYACDPGYYMVHSRRTISTNDISTRCQADKTWSRGPPTCEPIKCVPPFRTLRDGSVTCSNQNIYQSVCEFECDAGFNLIPAPRSSQIGSPYTSRCNEDLVLGDELGEWSEDAPSCQRGVCIPPRRTIRNGKIDCSNGNRMGSVCTYSCDVGYYMMGSELDVIRRNTMKSECLRTLLWDVDEPTCEPITCEPPHSDPVNGQVTCTNDNFHLSVCTFNCDNQYVRDGPRTSECQDDGNGDPIGVWSDPAPTCLKNFCDPERPKDPVNGYKVCTDANNLGSECEFACDDYHTRKGPLYSKCVKQRNGDLAWTNEPPICEPNKCKRRKTLAHGEISCTNDNFATSVCTYECTEDGYALYPPTLDTNVCMNDTHWDKRKPCCTRPCPPNAEMDAVFVLDSSSSVGRTNFLIMKDFVRGILAAFTVADDASRFSVLRYNKVVDEKNLIYLNDFSNSKEGLLEAYDKLPYDGSGTRTGNALEFVRDKIFTRRRGDRPNAPNLVIVMTDGRSQDEVKAISDSLRNEHNAFIFVVGIKPPRPTATLDMEQLLAIAGSPDNLMMADKGFEGLTGAFALELTDKVCGDPCDHKTHAHQIDNEDDGHEDHADE